LRIRYPTDVAGGSAYMDDADSTVTKTTTSID
jgi:hypothetical protein